MALYGVWIRWNSVLGCEGCVTHPITNSLTPWPIHLMPTTTTSSLAQERSRSGSIGSIIGFRAVSGVLKNRVFETWCYIIWLCHLYFWPIPRIISCTAFCVLCRSLDLQKCSVPHPSQQLNRSMWAGQVLHVCVCMYIYIHWYGIQMQIIIYTYIYICIYICMCIYIYNPFLLILTPPHNKHLR